MPTYEPGYFIKEAAASILGRAGKFVGQHREGVGGVAAGAGVVGLGMEGPELARKLINGTKKVLKISDDGAPDEREREVKERRLVRGMERRGIVFDPELGDFVPAQQEI